MRTINPLYSISAMFIVMCALAIGTTYMTDVKERRMRDHLSNTPMSKEWLTYSGNDRKVLLIETLFRNHNRQNLPGPTKEEYDKFLTNGMACMNNYAVRAPYEPLSDSLSSCTSME